MRVLIIPEDFRQDQYVLIPVVEAMLAKLGKKTAKVKICREPLVTGVTDVLRWSRIEEILDRYAWGIDLFLLLVDRDGEVARVDQLTRLEIKAAEYLETAGRFLGENAWQASEVWALAGQDDLPKTWRWSDIRIERYPKETYFEPYVQTRNLEHEPGAGRRTLGREAKLHYKRVLSRCPDDVGRLHSRLSNILGA